MSVQTLVRSIKVGIRSRWAICLITIGAAYSAYLITDPIIRFLSIIVLMCSAEAMVLTWGHFFIDNFFEAFKHKGKINWETGPLRDKLVLLATVNGVKLNKKKPLGIKQDFDNAYAKPSSGQIVVGDRLVKELSGEELLALFGHELTHLKQHHGLYLMTLSTFSMIAILPLAFLGAPDVVKNLGYFAVFFLAFSLASRRYEIKADAGAAEIASPEAVISLLRHIVIKNRWKSESETHPSVLRRIRCLRRLR